MDPQTFANLLAWGAQMACVVGLAAALSWLLRVDAARVRYAYWRGVLLFCLALPWVPPRATEPATETTAVTATFSVALGAPAVPVAETAGPGLWLACALVAAGGAARTLWLGLSVVRLRRLRATGVPARDEAYDDLQRELGTGAEIRYVPGASQPVTFGARRPVVLLPEALRAHPLQIRRAVVCHELLHVRRHDWLWLVAEELVRAALWFHPAIWWLVSRIQQAREEVVDERAVRITRGRRAYVEALMMFADGEPRSATAAFSRRSHLFRRIVLVSKEAAMSARHVVCACAVMALVLGGGGWYVTGLFPLVPAVAAQELLTEPGPLERAGKPITPENPLPRRIYAAPAIYPAEGLASQARAVVSLRLTLDERGSVGEVRRIRVSMLAPGVPAADVARLEQRFVTAAADAARRWQYDPPADAPVVLDAVFDFRPDAAEASAAQGAPGSVAAPRVAGPVAGVEPPYAAQALRVGGNVREPAKIRHVSPVYPEAARQARVSGIVIVEVLIGPDGRVAFARVLRSVSLLDQAALDAIMQWEFTPTLLNGAPVPLRMTVTVNFSLN